MLKTVKGPTLKNYWVGVSDFDTHFTTKINSFDAVFAAKEYVEFFLDDEFVINAGLDGIIVTVKESLDSPIETKVRVTGVQCILYDARIVNSNGESK